MALVVPPPLLFRSRSWSTEELAGMAGAWRASLGEGPPAAARLLAMVMAGALPRLPSGRIDRRACIAILAVGRDGLA